MSGPAVTETTRADLARSVLTRNLKLRRGERLIVEAWTHTLPWATAFLREARRLGASPMVVYDDEHGYWDAVEAGEAKAVGTIGRQEWAALRASDVYVHMWGPGDRLRLNALPDKTQKDLFGWNERWYAVANAAKLRGARLEIGRPYPSLAAAYGVDEAAWTDQLVRATLVDPTRLARAAAPIATALSKGSRLRIRHPNGTDLTVGLAHRAVRQYTASPRPASRLGRYDRLMTVPGGVVGTSLDESVADGTFVANRTNYFDDGIATGGVFHFRHGKLTGRSFDVGAERFDRPYAKGGKGRDRPGMLRIGLNPELHNTPQVEDIERGAVMVSVGGNKYAGGRNTSSFFGFAICAGGSVEIDGRPVPI